MRSTTIRSALAICLGAVFLTAATTSVAEEMESSMARGGKLILPTNSGQPVKRHVAPQTPVG